MAPSIEDLEKIISRDLKQKDVLIRNDGSLYEVVEPILRGNLDKGRAKVKILTSVGLSSNHTNVDRDFSIFSGIVRVEDRTDIKQKA